jgi:hypothetical protein
MDKLFAIARYEISSCNFSLKISLIRPMSVLGCRKLIEADSKAADNYPSKRQAQKQQLAA